MNRSGLTLVELLVAIVFIAVTMIAITNTQISNLRVTRDSQAAIAATELAAEKLEEVGRKVLQLDSGTGKYAIEAYYNCPATTSVACSESGSAGAYSYSINFTGAEAEAQAQGLNPYEYDGLVRADVSVMGPESTRVVSYFSCYDVYPAPTLNQPKACDP